MFVSCVCYVLSGRGLFVGLITRPEESYRLSECDGENLAHKEAWPTGGCCVGGEGDIFRRCALQKD
jgi:hypothetical protein